jgi:hypothetical protein
MTTRWLQLIQTTKLAFRGSHVVVVVRVTVTVLGVSIHEQTVAATDEAADSSEDQSRLTPVDDCILLLAHILRCIGVEVSCYLDYGCLGQQACSGVCALRRCFTAAC